MSDKKEPLPWLILFKICYIYNIFSLFYYNNIFYHIFR